MKYISEQQLANSLRALAEFRSKVNQQGAQHILSFLALRKSGVGTKSLTKYTETDDKNFFNEFARVAPEGSDPYFDPIRSMYRIETHPHSNVATARKGTFARSWGAATFKESKDGDEQWKLEPDYVKIMREKVLTKRGHVTRVPALPLAAFLFRTKEFPDKLQSKDLGAELKTTFGLTDAEYSSLFEDDTQIGEFSNARLRPEDVQRIISESGVLQATKEARTDFQELAIPADDKILAKVRSLLFDDGYAGVVFAGPPGTSKSWYAVQVSLALADGDIERVRKIQFHKSYQYEHFVEGFVPNKAGTGFELKPQLMLRAVVDATNNPGATYVVLIDELSRSDPGRVFGELLTYMEPTRRNEAFVLASGTEVTVPSNIVFIATMNSRDKSVVEIDDAFDRRMAKIEFMPDSAILEGWLRDAKVAEDFSRRVVAFFKWVQEKYPLGHTFLFSVRDADSFRRAWDSQLRFVLEKQFKYEPHILGEIKQKCSEIVGVNL
jgi:5-methylcytosine-specific restriction protein B